MDRDAEYWAGRPDTNEYWKEYLPKRSWQLTKELVRIVGEYCGNLPIGATCHELGAGVGRNLAGISEAHPDWRLSANDVNAAAPSRMVEAFPSLVDCVDYHIQPTQQWVLDMVASKSMVDVVVSVAHLLHIAEVGELCCHIAQLTRRFLVLCESAGTLTAPEARRRWEDAGLLQRGSGRWFDRDYVGVLGQWMSLVYRARWDTLSEDNPRAYDFYVFESRGETI